MFEVKNNLAVLTSEKMTFSNVNRPSARLESFCLDGCKLIERLEA
jgi:hypothetical protein